MSFSKETQQKIDRFAAEMSQRYLSDVEMTHLESLRKNVRQGMSSVGEQIAKFRAKSGKSIDAQNDLALYMSDYMSDLMSQGLTEQGAFEKAKMELSATNTEQASDLHERFIQYYKNRDPAEEEAIGSFYGGFLFLGVAVGGLIGFLVSGGVPAFSADGWIYTLVGVVTGAFIGIGLGLISNAIIAAIKRS
jgi:hypothetical protein